jgi:predicted Zn-ribbon and HTH transcriptional regulator
MQTSKQPHCPACYSKDIDSSNLFLFKRYNFEKGGYEPLFRLGAQCQSCGHLINAKDLTSRS